MALKELLHSVKDVQKCLNVSENVLFTEGSNPYIERTLPYYFKGVDSRVTTLIQEFRTIYLKRASQILRGIFHNMMYKAGRYFKA